MFRKLVEIRLEARYGPYGHYNVRGPASHVRRLLGGVGKVASGAVGLGSLGTVSVGRHPGTDRDAAEKRKAEHDAERSRKRSEIEARKAERAAQKASKKVPVAGSDVHAGGSGDIHD